LRALRAARLHTLYLGLESGDEVTLRRMRKFETAAGMVAAGIRAQARGLRLSVMVLLGLGGADRTREHAVRTAEALNRLQPRLLSVLRVVPIPGTPLYDEIERGRFRQLTEFETIEELARLVAGLDLTRAVFRANHSSNVVPLEAALPRDKPRLLRDIEELLASGVLDRETPGPMPLWL
jgi:radical SAM superfamily enzyme YgiQ (UPF0313 family)